MNAWEEKTKNPFLEYQIKLSEYIKQKQAYDDRQKNDSDPFQTLTFAEIGKAPKRPSVVSYNETGISLHVYTGCTYDIWPWSRIDTVPKLLSWVRLLSFKPWCNRYLIRDLIELVMSRFGLEEAPRW